MPTTWYDSIISKIEPASPNVKRFWLENPNGDRPDFQAGQFITMDLPIGDKRLQRWRSYSISSWPDGTNVFELLIVLAQGGLGTSYLFNEVKVGTEISLRGAQGVFILPSMIKKDIFLICTCLLYTSPSPRDRTRSRMPSSA